MALEGIKGAAERALYAVRCLGAVTRRDLKERGEIAAIGRDYEARLLSARRQQIGEEKCLAHEREALSAQVTGVEQRLFYTYSRVCEYLNSPQVPLARAAREGAVPRVAESLRLWQPAPGYLMLAVLAGLSVSAAAVLYVTLFGHTGSGYPIAALHGFHWVNAVLAALGGGPLSQGGFGMRGGLFFLAASVVVPVSAAVFWATRKKISKDYESVMAFKESVEAYAKEVARYEERAGLLCSRYRKLSRELYAFSLFFHEALNVGAGVLNTERAEYVAILSEAARLLISLCRLEAADEAGRPREDFEAELDALLARAAQCRREFIAYYMGLSSRGRALADAARERDITHEAENIRAAVERLRAEMHERFDAEEKKRAEETRSLTALLSSLKCHQRELGERLESRALQAEEREAQLAAFCRRVSVSLVDADILRGEERRAREERRLAALFGEEWERLTEESRSFLATARVLYTYLCDLEGADFSGVCLLVSKALETELQKRFFTGFGAFLEEKYPFDENPAAWPTALARRNRWGVYEKKTLEDFTLGSVSVACCLWSPPYVSDAEHERDLARLGEFAGELFVDSPEERVHETGKVADRVSKSFRNPAAHTEAMGRDRARSCLSYLIEDEGVFVSLMRSFKS